MKVVTLLNEKGGVGKTTLSITLASALAILGHRLLVIDADAQGHVAVSLGVVEEPGLYNLLVRNAPFSDVIRPLPAEIFAHEGQTRGSMSIIPSNLETRNIASSMSDGMLLDKRLSKLRDVFDFVLIDTSPTPSLLHTMLLAATDYVIYPTKLESLAFDGLRKSTEHIANLNEYWVQRGSSKQIEELGIVPTMTELSTLEHAENLKLLQQNFGNLVWRPLAKRTVWREATTAGLSIFAYAPDSREVKEALRMVQHMLGVVNVS